MPKASGTEFRFNQSDFRFIADFIGTRTGIVLGDVKRDLVYGRLAKRIRQLGLSSFSEYCDLLASDQDEEIEYCVNALTTNLTAFFREPHHFRRLEEQVIPDLMERKQDRELRIWSAGCSTGEEAYSIACTAHNCLPQDWDIKVLATDLDTNVLNTAAAGVYKLDRLAGVDQKLLQRYFLKGTGSRAGMVRIKPEIRGLIHFQRLNLLDPWPMKKCFDIIFCRNVVIYFNKDTQRTLFGRFADQLHKSSYLFIGHAETLHNVSERFELTGNTIYRRVS